MTSNAGGHAEPRIGVDIGRAHVALHQLVRDVVVFGQELAGHIEGHAVRSVLCYCLGKSPRHEVGCFVPIRVATVYLRHQQPVLKRQGLAKG